MNELEKINREFFERIKVLESENQRLAILEIENARLKGVVEGFERALAILTKEDDN